MEKEERKKERKGRRRGEEGRKKGLLIALDAMPIWVGQMVGFELGRHIDCDN